MPDSEEAEDGTQATAGEGVEETPAEEIEAPQEESEVNEDPAPSTADQSARDGGTEEAVAEEAADVAAETAGDNGAEAEAEAGAAEEKEEEADAAPAEAEAAEAPPEAQTAVAPAATEEAQAAASPPEAEPAATAAEEEEEEEDPLWKEVWLQPDQAQAMVAPPSSQIVTTALNLQQRITAMSDAWVDLEEPGGASASQKMTISGKSRQQVQRASKYVRLCQSAYKGAAKVTEEDNDGDLTMFPFPADLQGFVLGREGRNLVRISEESGTLCFLLDDKKPPPPPKPVLPPKPPSWLETGKRVEVKRGGDIRKENWMTATMLSLINVYTARIRLDASNGLEVTAYVSSLRPHFEVGQAVALREGPATVVDVSVAGKVSVKLQDGDAVVEADVADVQPFEETVPDEPPEPEESEAPAPEETEDPNANARVAVFGKLAERCAAILLLMRSVDKRWPNHYNGQEPPGGWGAAPGEDWGSDVIDLGKENMSKFIGKQGAMRRKLAKATGCVMDVMEGSQVYVCGTEDNRSFARGLLDTLIDVQYGCVQKVPDENTLSFCKTVTVPADVEKHLLGKGRGHLNSIEEEDGVIVFFQKPEAEKPAQEEWVQEEWQGEEKAAAEEGDAQPEEKGEAETSGADAPQAEDAEDANVAETIKNAEAAMAAALAGEGGDASEEPPDGEETEAAQQEVDKEGEEADKKAEDTEEPAQEDTVWDKWEESKDEKAEEEQGWSNWDKWDEPKEPEQIKVLIFSHAKLSRDLASLRIMSRVEEKAEGLFSKEFVPAPSDEAGLDQEVAELPAGAWGNLPAEPGRDLKQAAVASGCGIVSIGSIAVFVGDRDERARGRDYCRWVCEGHGSNLRLPKAVLEGRVDVTVVQLAAEDRTLLDDSALASIATGTDTLLFFRELTHSELLTSGTRVQVYRWGRAVTADIVESEDANGALSLRLVVCDEETADASDSEPSPELLIFGGHTGRTTAERQILDTIAKAKTAELWGKWNENAANAEWDSGAAAAEEPERTWKDRNAGSSTKSSGWDEHKNAGWDDHRDDWGQSDYKEASTSKKGAAGSSNKWGDADKSRGGWNTSGDDSWDQHSKGGRDNDTNAGRHDRDQKQAWPAGGNDYKSAGKNGSGGGGDSGAWSAWQKPAEERQTARGTTRAPPGFDSGAWDSWQASESKQGGGDASGAWGSWQPEARGANSGGGRDTSSSKKQWNQPEKSWW